MRGLAFFIAVLGSLPAGYGQLTSLQNINAWAYQLQYTNPAGIAPDNSFQLLVTDYSYDAGPTGIYTPAQVQAMKTGGKKVIAYISIGEAENYRYYWQPAWNTNPPAWMGPENPYWDGNFKVKFWYPEWKGIIYNYIDTILSRGYDGIYMDIVEAFYYWQEENPQEPYADTLMVNFIAGIRHHVDSVLGNTSFIVMPQNAEEIIDAPNIDVPLKDKYFNCINAIGVEDIFFPGNNDMNNNYVPDTYRIGLLEEFKNRGKRVFSIEYIDEPAKLSQYITNAQTNNYVPYACTRALNYICTQLTGINTTESPIGQPVIQVAGEDLIITFAKPLKNSALQLTDMQGRVVAQTASTGLLQWQVTALTPGLYLLSVNKQGFTTCFKVLVP